MTAPVLFLPDDRSTDTHQPGMGIWRGRHYCHGIALVVAEPQSHTLGGSPATLPPEPLAGGSSASR